MSDEPRPVQVVEVRRRRDGRWSWRYREGPDHRAFQSNEDYETKEAAVAAARMAYPGVPITEARDAGGRRSVRSAVRPLPILAGAGLGAGTAAAAMLLSKVLRLALRVRRLLRTMR